MEKQWLIVETAMWCQDPQTPFDISVTSPKTAKHWDYLYLCQNLESNLVSKDVDELILDVGKCVSCISDWTGKELTKNLSHMHPLNSKELKSGHNLPCQLCLSSNQWHCQDGYGEQYLDHRVRNGNYFEKELIGHNLHNLMLDIKIADCKTWMNTSDRINAVLQCSLVECFCRTMPC